MSGVEPRRPRRPALLGPAALATVPGGPDPAQLQAVAHQTARLLVDESRSADDEALTRRLVELTDEHGLELVAHLWSQAPAESLPGALWRLYALRAWVQADPVGAARQFAEGRHRAPVLEAVAGVADPPGPSQVRELLDTVLRGVATGDLGTTLERAAAFARVVAVGRAELAAEDPGGAEPATWALTCSAARLVRTAEQLEAAAGRWRDGTLA